MANNENNRPQISRVSWFDGIAPENTDFQVDQDSAIIRASDIVNDFSGSGVLQKTPIVLPPILDTSRPNTNNISFSNINAGKYDGLGIFADRQPVDTTYGDQLVINCENVDIPLYSPLKVAIFGKVYDPSIIGGTPTLEFLTFERNGKKATFNYFKSVIAIFFNNFSGGSGRTDIVASSVSSINTSINNTGKITIREVGPLEVLEHGVILHQIDTPNLLVRDFITSTITRTFKDELTLVINTAQNTGYASVSLSDLNQLPLNTSGITTKPFLDNTTSGVLYGQKIFIPTNNIQQLSFSLSLSDDAYGWSGEFVIGIRSLQTKSTNQFANKIDMDPDINILFEASFTQNDLFNNGFILTKVPQEIKFNFIGSVLGQPNGIIIPNQYYIITLTRRADISIGKILIDIGPKILLDSKFTTFSPITRGWIDDSQNDLWFKIYSAAIRVSSGIAYTTDGIMVSLQKTITAQDGSIVSAIAGPYSLAVVDPIASDNIVVLTSIQDYEDKGEHPRTGNLVFLRVIDKVSITIFSTTQFMTLVASTSNINQSNFPIVLGVVNDINNKLNIPFSGVITLPGQVRKDQIVLFNTNISDELLRVNNIIIPNNSTNGIKYRIVKSVSTTQYLGDFNNDKIFTSSDLVEQAIVQDTFSAQSTNTFSATSFDPYSIFDPRSRDVLGFGKETVENFILADVDGYLTINSIDLARLQYLTTTLPALVMPSPTITTVQELTLENITNVNAPILITKISNIDGYANANSPDQVAFTAINVGDMRAMSVGDIINLSADGYMDGYGRYINTAYGGLVINKFVQRNDLIIETRFLSNILPVIDTSYVLTFYSQQPVFNGKLGIFGETATEVLEFIAPGLIFPQDLIGAGIINGDILSITGDLLGESRNGRYTISQILNETTFRISSPTIKILPGIANAGIEIFASDGVTDKLNNTANIQFTVNTINLITANIQQGDILHITLGPVSLNGTYIIARIISSTVFTIVPPALTPQTFNATFEFRAAGDIIVKVPATIINSANLGIGPTPYIVSGLESLAPVNLPNGVDTLFKFSLTHIPATGIVSVHWVNNGIINTMIFSSGPIQITGDGNPSNSSINRISGEVILDTFLPPDANTAITIDYRIAPTITLKHCYPTLISSVSPIQTDIEFKVPFSDLTPYLTSTRDAYGIIGSPYVIIQTNNADPPAMVLDGYGSVVSGSVTPNTIDPINSVKLPSRNIVMQLRTASGSVPNITTGKYWMQIYSGERVNIQASQKEFLSDTLSFSSPINWTIQKNNFEWRSFDMVIKDYRRFLPAAFVSKLPTDKYLSKNKMWVPSDIYVGAGEILQSNGLPYHGDLEVTKINLDLPVTALLSNSINIYNNLIASYKPTPGITRAGQLAMKFSDGSYVGADDFGNDTALTRNQIRIIPTLGSLYLDGYQVSNSPTYTELDEVLTKLHYEIRSGMYFDDGYGILYFHIENILSIFENEPILQTGVVRIAIDVALKKSGFINPVVSINSVDILRLFTNPVNIVPATKYSISGQILSGFTVGRTTTNPDG